MSGEESTREQGKKKAATIESTQFSAMTEQGKRRQNQGSQ
jgi:hypothetical protein